MTEEREIQFQHRTTHEVRVAVPGQDVAAHVEVLERLHGVVPPGVKVELSNDDHPIEPPSLGEVVDGYTVGYATWTTGDPVMTETTWVTKADQ